MCKGPGEGAIVEDELRGGLAEYKDAEGKEQVSVQGYIINDTVMPRHYR